MGGLEAAKSPTRHSRYGDGARNPGVIHNRHGIVDNF
jgi:hypothetical protein